MLPSRHAATSCPGLQLCPASGRATSGPAYLRCVLPAAASLHLDTTAAALPTAAAIVSYSGSTPGSDSVSTVSVLAAVSPGLDPVPLCIQLQVLVQSPCSCLVYDVVSAWDFDFNLVSEEKEVTGHNLKSQSQIKSCERFIY